MPHSGAVAALGDVAAHVVEGAGAGVGERDGRRRDLGEQARPRVHRADVVVHRVERLGWLRHDDVDAVVERFELVVGDQRRDLDDHVAGDVETGHLEVEPHEAIGHDGVRARRHATGGAPVDTGRRVLAP